MNKNEAKTRIRLSHLILGLAVVTVVGAHAYGLWLASEREKQLTPRLALNSFNRVLLTYHKKAGRFPETLGELDWKTWQLRQAPEVGHQGHSFYFTHYFYLYTSPEPGVALIWAIPTGSRRDEGSTYFVVLSPEGLRRWKGPALPLDDLKQISLTPDEALLASLGLVEQPPIYFKRQSQRRVGM